MAFASPGFIRQHAADTRSSQWATLSLPGAAEGCGAIRRVGVDKQRRTTLQQAIDTQGIANNRDVHAKNMHSAVLAS